jgi:hypothetical protein
MAMKVLLAILVAAGSSMNIDDGLTFVAATTADAGDSRIFVSSGLSDVHSFAATNTDTASNATAASRPETRTVVSSITSFSATPRTHFQIGGDSYQVQGAGRSYSLTTPDPQTLRFEVRPGDQAWYDAGHAVDRNDVALDPTIPVGTSISIDYQFMVEPNGPNGTFVNTASWFTTAEMNGYPAVSSPPFEIGLVGNRLHVMARYCPPGQVPSNRAGNLTQLTLWTAPDPIQPGQYNDIKMSANVSNNSSGYLDVWVNGTRVVNYHGPLGYGTPTYWEYGLYRSAGPPETAAANFRNMTLTTGSGPPGVSAR